MLSQIQLVKLVKNQKIYDLEDTLNIIVSGHVYDESNDKLHKRFDVIADFPVQVNVLDHAKPIHTLTAL